MAPGLSLGVGVGVTGSCAWESSRPPEEVLSWQKPHSAQMFRGLPPPQGPSPSSSPGPASRESLLSRWQLSLGDRWACLLTLSCTA